MYCVSIVPLEFGIWIFSFWMLISFSFGSLGIFPKHCVIDIFIHCYYIRFWLDFVAEKEKQKRKNVSKIIPIKILSLRHQFCENKNNQEKKYIDFVSNIS